MGPFNCPLWDAAAQGDDVDLVLHDLTVTRPGGATFPSSGSIQWTLGQAPIVEIIDPEGWGESTPRKGSAGEPTPPEALWKVDGRAASGGPLAPQLWLTAAGLSPESSFDRRDFPPINPPRNRALVRFMPHELKIRIADQRGFRLGSSSRSGVISCTGVIQHSAHRPVRGYRGRGEFTTHQPFSEFRLFDGVSVHMHPVAAHHMFTSLFWPPGFGEQEASTAAFDFALGLSAGAQCRWLSVAEARRDVMTVSLNTPLEPWRAFPSRQGILSLAFDASADFLALLQSAYGTCRENPKLGRVLMSAHAMIWDSCASTMQVEGLVASATVETLVRELDHFLPRPTPASASDLLALLDAHPPIKAHPAYARLVGLVRSSWGQRSPSDVINDLASHDPPLVTREELQAWKRLRNLMAHGRFDPEEHRGVGSLYRTLLLTQNLVNKLTLALIGYEGRFTDYSLPNWPLVPFAWRRPALPGPIQPSEST